MAGGEFGFVFGKGGVEEVAGFVFTQAAAFHRVDGGGEAEPGVAFWVALTEMFKRRGVGFVLIAVGVDEDFVVVGVVVGAGTGKDMIDLEVGAVGGIGEASGEGFAAVGAGVGLLEPEFVTEEFVRVGRSFEFFSEAAAVGVFVFGAVGDALGDFVSLGDRFAEVAGEFNADASGDFSGFVDEVDDLLDALADDGLYDWVGDVLKGEVALAVVAIEFGAGFGVDGSFGKEGDELAGGEGGHGGGAGEFVEGGGVGAEVFFDGLDEAGVEAFVLHLIDDAPVFRFGVVVFDFLEEGEGMGGVVELFEGSL